MAVPTIRCSFRAVEDGELAEKTDYYKFLSRDPTVIMSN